MKYVPLICQFLALIYLVKVMPTIPENKRQGIVLLFVLLSAVL